MREAQRVSQEFPGREALFRSAFETAGHGMAIVGLDGRVLEANKAWLAIVGYSRDEIVGLDFPSITHPDDGTRQLFHTQTLLDGLAPSFAMEKCCIHRDGQVVWVLLTVGLIRGADTRPLHFVSQILDITERRQLEEAEDPERPTVCQCRSQLDQMAAGSTRLRLRESTTRKRRPPRRRS